MELISKTLAAIFSDPKVLADLFMGALLTAAVIWRAMHAKDANALAKEQAFEAKFRSYAAIAFHWIDDAEAMGVVIPGGDKTQAALVKLEELFKRDGLTLTDELKELAVDIWSAMHGAQTAMTGGGAKTAAPAPVTAPASAASPVASVLGDAAKVAEAVSDVAKAVAPAKPEVASAVPAPVSGKEAPAPAADPS